jgi:LysM repeat protein
LCYIWLTGVEHALNGGKPMKDDSGLHVDDESTDDRTYSSGRRRSEPSAGRLLPAFLIVLLAIMVVLGISYFLNKRPAGGDAALVTKMTALEEKIMSLEKQVTDLQGRPAAAAPDPSLAQRVDALSRKVEALERPKPVVSEPKAKPAPPKAAVTVEKRHHTVQKGDTLYKISKMYGVRVEELRKLNNLSENQPLKTGQKLLVSAE